MTKRGAWVNRLVKLLDQGRQRAFTYSDFTLLLKREGGRLGIPHSTGTRRLIETLLERTPLVQLELAREGEHPGVAKTVYVWGQASPYAIGQALAKGSYLSHASAMYLLALTDQVPKTIYVNKEQSPKPAPQGITSQEAIDRAFMRPPRVSNYAFLSPSARYVLLSGKNSGRLEVTEIELDTGELVDTTKLERTLVDIVVRPSYAGGIFEVARAFENAADRVSVGTFLAILKKLDHVYPYHQAVGFLLDRAGIPAERLSRLKSRGLEWDFYLDYAMNKPDYSPEWRLYYPKGL